MLPSIFFNRLRKTELDMMARIWISRVTNLPCFFSSHAFNSGNSFDFIINNRKKFESSSLPCSRNGIPWRARYCMESKVAMKHLRLSSRASFVIKQFSSIRTSRNEYFAGRCCSVTLAWLMFFEFFKCLLPIFKTFFPERYFHCIAQFSNYPDYFGVRTRSMSQNRQKHCNLAMEIAWTNRVHMIVFAFQRRFLGRHNCYRGDKVGFLTTVVVACHWSFHWVAAWRYYQLFHCFARQLVACRGRSVEVIFDAHSFFVRHRYLRLENLNLSYTSKTLESLSKKM